MKNKLLLGAAFLALAFLVSCNKEDQAEIDRDLIVQYVADNNLNATEHSSGIFYVIETPGSGGSPTVNDRVTVRYKGYYLDGEVFDETDGAATAKFRLSDLIEGWKIAIPLLQKGGKGTFIIPSALAYGPNPPFGVRANAVMVFEIELVDF
ncbi:MAG: FKBP-type peptidyl-prolyl cis-trans isomerase [Thermoanaerobaculia bacterium]|nr:FKBP-type peptidyl-prolyl cis-trans isomerase [Thermoanaerobaculia bacterium]